MWLFENLRSSRPSEKNAAHFRAEGEYVWIEPKFTIARRTIDNVLGAENSFLYTKHPLKVELEALIDYLLH